MQASVLRQYHRKFKNVKRLKQMSAETST